MILVSTNINAILLNYARLIFPGGARFFQGGAAPSAPPLVTGLVVSPIRRSRQASTLRVFYKQNARDTHEG